MADPVIRPPAHVAWVHIPKCGSSFDASVRIHGGHLHGTDGAHTPIAANATPRELGRYAVIFRHPEERLMSFYWWLRQMHMHCCTRRRLC